jgi:HPt (histidine-containing phosphotransfer) domain-containing protein
LRRSLRFEAHTAAGRSPVIGCQALQRLCHSLDVSTKNNQIKYLEQLDK